MTETFWLENALFFGCLIVLVGIAYFTKIKDFPMVIAGGLLMGKFLPFLAQVVLAIFVITYYGTKIKSEKMIEKNDGIKPSHIPRIVLITFLFLLLLGNLFYWQFHYERLATLQSHAQKVFEYASLFFLEFWKLLTEFTNHFPF